MDNMYLDNFAIDRYRSSCLVAVAADELAFLLLLDAPCSGPVLVVRLFCGFLKFCHIGPGNHDATAAAFLYLATSVARCLQVIL